MAMNTEPGLGARASSAPDIVTRYPRAWGAALVAVGACILYALLVVPLRAVLHGADTLTVSNRGVVLGMLIVTVGFVGLLFGRRGVALIAPPDLAKLPKGSLVLYGALGVLALASLLGLRYALVFIGFDAP